MTRAEAIERMQLLMNDCNRCPCITEICKKRGVYDDCMKEAEAFKMAIEALSIDIIRCKDCKHMIINKNHENKPMICCLTKMCGTTDADWFCADGERKKE